MLAIAVLAMSAAVVLAGGEVVEASRGEQIDAAVTKFQEDIVNDPSSLALNLCGELADSAECDVFQQAIVAEEANGDAAVIDTALRGVFLESVQDTVVERDAKIDELENLGAEDDSEAILAEVTDLIDEQTIFLQTRAGLYASAADELAAHDVFVTNFEAAVAASEARITDFNRILELEAELNEKIAEAEADEEDFDDRDALQTELDGLITTNEAALTEIANALPNGSNRFAFAKRVFDAANEQALLFASTSDEDADGNVVGNKVRLTHVVQDDLTDFTDLAATYPDVEYELVAADTKKRAEAAVDTYEANCASNLNLEENELELCKQQLAQFVGDSKAAFSTVLVLDAVDMLVAESTNLADLQAAAAWQPSWSEKSESSESNDYYGNKDEESEEEEEDSATLASLSLSLLSLAGLRSLF